MDTPHELIRQIGNGYRMEKPEFASNFIGEIMQNCWNKNPQERPTFSQLEAAISNHLESSVSSYYLDLNCSYAKMNEDIVKSSGTSNLGLAQLLNEKNRIKQTKSVPAQNGILRRMGSQFMSLKQKSSLNRSHKRWFNQSIELIQIIQLKAFSFQNRHSTHSTVQDSVSVANQYV